MARHSDDDYDRPPRRSKTMGYRNDSDSDDPKPSRRRPGPEPRSSGSDRDRRPGKSYGSDDYGKSSRNKDRDRASRKVYDDDDSNHRSSRGKGKDLDTSDILPPRKNEGRTRATTLDSNGFDAMARKDSKRYDDRRDKKPSKYDDYDDSLAAVKPSRRPKADDRGYKSYDDARSKKRDDDKYRRSGRDSYAEYGRSDRDRDRDRDRGYRSMDEGKRRGDSYRSSRDRDRDRDRDRRTGYDRYDSYGDRDSDRPRIKQGKSGIKFDPDAIRGYYETGQKHYQTFKPLIHGVAKLYMDSRR